MSGPSSGLHRTACLSLSTDLQWEALTVSMVVAFCIRCPHFPVPDIRTRPNKKAFYSTGYAQFDASLSSWIYWQYCPYITC